MLAGYRRELALCQRLAGVDQALRTNSMNPATEDRRRSVDVGDGAGRERGEGKVVTTREQTGRRRKTWCGLRVLRCWS